VASVTFVLCLRSRRAGTLPGWAAVSGMVVAVLLLTAFVVAPALLLPAWVIIAGFGARRIPANAPTPATVHAVA
jgi:hypothetical protein